MVKARSDTAPVAASSKYKEVVRHRYCNGGDNVVHPWHDSETYAPKIMLATPTVFEMNALQVPPKGGPEKAIETDVVPCAKT